jgi:hypothetical protein
MFVIHYRYGAVHSSNVGADLSEFQCEKLQLTDPQSIRIGQFKKNDSGVFRVGS